MVGVDTVLEQIKPEYHAEDLIYGKKTERQKFYKRLAERSTQVNQDYKPFCHRCCKLDFEEMQERMWKEKGVRTGATQMENVKIPDFNFEEYASVDKFNFKSRTDVIENKLIDSVRVQIATGEFRNYLCRRRNCGLTIQIPIEKIKGEKK
ncbi:MAG: hypothetical protein A2Z57_07065 [Planctomycetes bacterium RIFCSPHIGHO2_12_39_6]|nr:MAG: hypothetical protein A2Z57_07065 [Planctomycetes bacterium RIFCSPHIGHO2_12_39_6]